MVCQNDGDVVIIAASIVSPSIALSASALRALANIATRTI
jgi:hypothetical protein